MDNTSLQHILHQHLISYQQHHQLSPEQSKACYRIAQCRTDALGGNQLICQQCGYQQTQYHSCRNRHCPQCQYRATQAWSEKQCRQLLSVHYHHLVFTLPHTLNPWAKLHPEIIYQLLFQSAWHTLNTFGKDPKRLNGELGMVAVLHTWGQMLTQHIHLHCLVPAGAWNSTTQTWKPAKGNYLFPVRALSRHFRGYLVSQLRQQQKQGKLNRIMREFDQTLKQLMAQEWVVYNKPHLEQPQTVIRYLARYTHKIAIDNHRIKRDENNNITFQYKDYRHHDKQKQMTLHANEFIRRFLLHVLPDGFMRIRHYGFLANSCRAKKLPAIRTVIDKAVNLPTRNSHERLASYPSVIQRPESCCPQCKTGQLIIAKELSPERRRKRCH